MADMAAKHRRAGVKNPNAKLTEQQVRHIFTSSLPACDLIIKYRIGNPAISNIRGGRRWQHLTSALKRGEYARSGSQPV